VKEVLQRKLDDVNKDIEKIDKMEQNYIGGEIVNGARHDVYMQDLHKVFSATETSRNKEFNENQKAREDQFHQLNAQPSSTDLANHHAQAMRRQSSHNVERQHEAAQFETTRREWEDAHRGQKIARLLAHQDMISAHRQPCLATYLHQGRQ